MEIDDLFATKSKKVNGCSKGKRVERLAVKVFTDRFGEGFSRSIGSGNRWSQVSFLPKHAQDTFSGDLVTPTKFLYTVECKGGYDDVDIENALDGGNSQLNEFLEQAEFDSGRCNKKPLLIWKKNRKKWLAFIKTEHLPHSNWEYRIIYREWSGLILDELLKLDNTFFFNG